MLVLVKKQTDLFEKELQELVYDEDLHVEDQWDLDPYFVVDLLQS